MFLSTLVNMPYVSDFRNRLELIYFFYYYFDKLNVQLLV